MINATRDYSPDPKKTFKTILIANRGEIAVRIIQSARRLGYRTIALYSQADALSRHVLLADQAVGICGNTPGESYLCIEKVLDACTKSGADAVHPGYGFLSENPQFAQACKDRGLTFIGPSVEAIEKMGNKSQAKDLMLKAGVPCIPGYQGPEQDLDLLAARGIEIGFPLMVKAAAGGGGRGLRLAYNKDQLPGLLQSARGEAEKAFGCGDLLLERALIGARHIEIQVFGDHFGNIIHLGERDCSVQRRHQKVFEESPSPAVNEALRQRMGASAVQAAQSIGYTGAGTVEFLLDRNGEYYFLEMNTRLQVEHPVTEMITGIDLVEWQLLIAAGYPLPITQDQVTFNGHAIEARLYAEDPDNDFRPQVGPVLCFDPPSPDLARCDHGLNCRDYVSPYYDSMLAKVITAGPDRQAALRRLELALADMAILGVKTNRQFLLACLNSPAFIDGRADTSFVEQAWQPRSKQNCDPDITVVLMAASLLLANESPFRGELNGWSNTGEMHAIMKLAVDESLFVDLQADYISDNCWRMIVNEREHVVSLLQTNDARARFVVDGVSVQARFVVHGQQVHISAGAISYIVEDILFKERISDDSNSHGDVLAPSNGLVSSIEVSPGQTVRRGDLLCTVEAMKLIQTVCAPVSGIVSTVCVDVGQQIKTKQVIARIEPNEALAVPPEPQRCLSLSEPPRS